MIILSKQFPKWSSILLVVGISSRLERIYLDWGPDTCRNGRVPRWSNLAVAQQISEDSSIPLGGTVCIWWPQLSNWNSLAKTVSRGAKIKSRSCLLCKMTPSHMQTDPFALEKSHYTLWQQDLSIYKYLQCFINIKASREGYIWSKRDCKDHHWKSSSRTLSRLGVGLCWRRDQDRRCKALCHSEALPQALTAWAVKITASSSACYPSEFVAQVRPHSGVRSHLSCFKGSTSSKNH